MKRMSLILPAGIGASVIAFAIVFAGNLARRPIWDEWAGRDGEKEAYADLGRGKLVVLEYGLYLPWDEERRAVMMSEYKVECRAVGGCLVSPTLVEFAVPYNKVMKAQIVALYGDDVFDRASSAGRALCASRYPPEQANKALEPTPTSVTSPAAQEPRQP
jgi:hypothetical protein